MSGEVDSFNAHYPAFIALTACQILWKFGTIFKVKAKKNFLLTFFVHQVYLLTDAMHKCSRQQLAYYNAVIQHSVKNNSCSVRNIMHQDPMQ